MKTELVMLRTRDLTLPPGRVLVDGELEIDPELDAITAHAQMCECAEECGYVIDLIQAGPHGTAWCRAWTREGEFVVRWSDCRLTEVRRSNPRNPETYFVLWSADERRNT